MRLKEPRVRPGRLLAAVLLALCCLCGGVSAGRFTGLLRPGAGGGFAEPLIERAVRLQLGKETGPLTPEDLAQITGIYIYADEVWTDPDGFFRQRPDRQAMGPIRTLDDLARLENLAEVHIARQGDVDVSALAGLRHVETVEFKHMRISGLEPVARLPGLKHAVLFDCGLTGVTALEACTQLESLDIGLNGIGSLAAIGSHPGMRGLSLTWLELPDLNGLGERMPRLESVNLKYSTVSDLSGLAGAPLLKMVFVLPEQEAAVRAALAERPEVRILTEEE